MAKLSAKDVSVAGLIASLYVVLGLALAPISFGVYQVRVAEALTVLAFLTPAAIPGLYVGCLLANTLAGGMGWPDILFGPLITLAAAVLTRSAFHLSRRAVGAILVALPLVLMWIGAICLLNDFQCTLEVVPGMLLVVVVFVAIAVVERCSVRGATSRAVTWVLRIIILLVTAIAVHMLRLETDTRQYLIGGLVLLAAAVMFMVLTRTWYKGENPNLLVAPLPPVVLNAFLVSAYLAPIIGVDYWFCVQMIGVGQLIACYLIGLPLLMTLNRRKSFFI